MIRDRRWLVGSAVLAVAVYAAIWIAVELQWDWLRALDAWALDNLIRTDSAAWVTGWDVICTLLGPNAFRLLTVGVIVAALVRRNLRVAAFLVISVELSGLVTEIAKYVADRPRPATAQVHAYGLAFPSGHALGVLVCVLALLTVVLPVVRPWLRGWLIASGVVIVVAIGIGRVVLNVHHPSDVLAGWALGYAYFVFCVMTVSPNTPITAMGETPAAPGTAR